MPIVQIHMLEGRTIDQKRAVAKKVTDAICEAVSCPADAVKIIISDMAKEDYSVAGTLVIDSKK